MEKRTRSNKGLLFMAGALAGATAAYYLNTPQGKELRNKISNSTQEALDKTRIKATELKESASEMASNATQVFKEKSANVLEATEEKVSQFQKGINKAKKNLTNGIESLS